MANVIVIAMCLNDLRVIVMANIIFIAVGYRDLLVVVSQMTNHIIL